MKKRKRRELKEEVSKEFLMSLLAPFYPILKANESVTDISIKTNYESYELTYVITQEGGVENNP